MARISENSSGKLITHFESVSEIWRTIDSLNWTPQREEASDRRGHDGDFYTFSSLSEALDVYKNRPETIRRFTNADIKLESIESPGKDVFFDVTGDYVAVDRYLDGDPEDQGNMVMGNPRSMFATINISVGYVNWTTNEYLARKQRRILRLVDWLESQNIRCQIVATEVTEIQNFSVIVKQFTDPVDLNDLAIVCHGDFLRRVLFLMNEQSKTWSWGYGDCIDYDERMKKYTPQPEDGMYIYVGGYIPYRKLSDLEENFDEIEATVKHMVEDNMTWNEEPIVFRGLRG